MSKSKTFSVRLPVELVEALKRQAKKENRSVNNLIETVLKKEFPINNMRTK